MNTARLAVNIVVHTSVSIPRPDAEIDKAAVMIAVAEELGIGTTDFDLDDFDVLEVE